jgi:diguanylate cyclase (GGDEF)-like protein
LAWDRIERRIRVPSELDGMDSEPVRDPGHPIRVLLVENDPIDAHLAVRALRRAGDTEVAVVGTLREALRAIEEGSYDVIVADMDLPDSTGFTTVESLDRAARDMPILMVSGGGDENAALENVRRGAQDFLLKGEMDSGLLSRALRYAIERKRSQTKLQYMALRDGVTELYNRFGFRTALARALEAREEVPGCVGVLYVDLDRFKAINDSLGHDAGDELLRIVAQRLSKTVRDNDVVARIGGDEFAIVVPELTSIAELRLIGQRLLNAFAEPIHLSGVEVSVTGSVGGSHFPACGTSVDELVTAADRAMYRAKSTGRNRCYCALGIPEMASLPQSRARELHFALQEDQFALVYQPQVDGRDGRIVGYEALIRWDHPTLGRMPPNDFLPMLEETGLIRSVGAWVLRTAVEFLWKMRQQTGEWRRMAVNVSATQLDDGMLIEEVTEVLERLQVPPSCIELEFTEAAVMRDVPRTAQVLGRLRNLGVRIALDDFGTGYSSLSHLRRFQVDTLKIDRSFVQDTKDHALVGGIISLGLALGLTVVGEGVETEAQRDFLVGRGCEVLQGYMLGRPADPDTYLVS